MKLVTGAKGFIGSHLVEKLDANVARCDPADPMLIQPKLCTRYLNMASWDIECAFHLGAISSTAETDISKLTESNIFYSCQLLDFCIERSVPFVYASSASVYGLATNGFKEDGPLAPLNYYAISKTAFDMYALQKMKDNPTAKIVGLRYFNVYGKNETHKGNMASPVHKFIRQAHESGTIKIFEGSEKFVRDFVHVDDVVDITIAAKDFESGIYNVGTAEARSFVDVARIIADLTDANIVEIPFPDYLEGKYQEYTCSDNAKINSTGYTANRISLEEGVKRVASD